MLRQSGIYMLLMSAALLRCVVANKHHTSVRSETKDTQVSVDAHGGTHTESDGEHLIDEKDSGLIQVAVNEQGDTINLAHAHKTHTHEAADSEDAQRLHHRARSVGPSVAHFDDRKSETLSLEEQEGEDVDKQLDELEAMTLTDSLTRKDSKKNVALPPPVNCKWSEWATQGECSRTCGGGKLKEVRQRVQKAKNNGTDCEGKNHRETACREEPCPTTTNTTTTMMVKAGAIGTVSNLPALFFLLLLTLGAHA